MKQIENSNYYITDEGKVYRKLKDGTLKEMSTYNQDTKQVVRLSGIGDHIDVSRLVAKYHMIGYNGGEIQHINQDIYDNRISNLKEVKHRFEYLKYEDYTNDGIRVKNINIKYWIGIDGNVYVRDYKNKVYTKKYYRQNSKGYLYMNVVINMVRVYKPIHNIVAEAFIPKVEGKDYIDHINENKVDNRVENLRWCTIQENNTYYNTKNGRDYKLKLRKKYKEEAAKLLKQNKLLEKELIKLKKEVRVMQTKLQKEKDKFIEYKKKEIERINRSNVWYKNTTGMKFESIKKMVEITGKPIHVNNKYFISCGAAARYIVEEEAKLGYIRRVPTISKELRKYLRGDRAEWKMYGRYFISKLPNSSAVVNN